MEKTILNCAAECLKYKSYEELTKQTGILLKVEINNITNIAYLQFKNSDLFYKSYSKGSLLYIGLIEKEKNPFKNKEIEKIFKARISGLLRQQRELSYIKEIAIKEIKKFISDSFDVDERLIDTKDITFLEYSRFSVAGVNFNFTGTIAHNTFIISTLKYYSYKESYLEVVMIKDFYNSKQKDHDTKY